MIPILQTKFSNRELSQHGNCFAACIASLLEIDIADVPPWEKMGNDGSWADSYYAFLDSHGLEADGMILFESHSEDTTWNFILDTCKGIDGYFIVGGESPRGTKNGHAVIYHNRKMVHDPHPSNLGLSSIREVYLISRKEKMTNINLLPCPFCGSPATFVERGDFYTPDAERWDVACTNRNCYLSLGADWWDEKDNIALLWNTRTLSSCLTCTKL